jgi:hypothetical protein
MAKSSSPSYSRTVADHHRFRIGSHIGLSCLLLLLLCPKVAYLGSKAMEWFQRKTSIAGYEISNWIIVLGAIIIALLIFQNLH